MRVGDVPERPRNPSGSLPAVGRTPTPAELARAIDRLGESINKRLEYVERAADSELLPFIRETGARYAEVASAVAGLSATVGALKSSIDQWRADIVKQLDDHDERLLVVEDKSTRHQVRLDALEDTIADQQVRVRSLERHQTETTTELALTRRQKGGVAALGGFSGVIAALLARLLGG